MPFLPQNLIPVQDRHIPASPWVQTPQLLANRIYVLSILHLSALATKRHRLGLLKTGGQGPRKELETPYHKVIQLFLQLLSKSPTDSSNLRKPLDVAQVSMVKDSRNAFCWYKIREATSLHQPILGHNAHSHISMIQFIIVSILRQVLVNRGCMSTFQSTINFKQPKEEKLSL
jgi:hypothetical protein